MPYSANQYNYATPLTSVVDFVNPGSSNADYRYFTLFDNTLDGTYYPVSGDAGLWGTSLSDDSGSLPEPFTVTVNEHLTINTFGLVGSDYCFPVDFNVTFYDADNTPIHSIAEIGNTRVNYCHVLSSTVECASFTITVTKVSRANSVAVLRYVHNPAYVRRSDTIRLAAEDIGQLSSGVYLRRTDRVELVATESVSAITNSFASRDDLRATFRDIGIPTNIHTVMKGTSRRVFGKVYITYADPMLEVDTSIETNMEAHNSRRDQIVDGITTSNGRYFTLYDNDLSGDYAVITEQSQIGWVSGIVSNSDGRFTVDPYVSLKFSSRPVLPLTVHFDDSHGCLAEDFTVKFGHEDGTISSFDFTGNSSVAVQVNDSLLVGVVSFTVIVHKASMPGFPVALLEVPIVSTMLYEGSDDHSDLMSVDILEELTYEDDVEALGGVSANEVTAVIDNSDKGFYFNNQSSAVARQLRRNRKIEPWLGAEIAPGIVEWYKQGVYWSYSWTVPVNSLTATVVGFDTLGLLDTTSFVNHTVQVNKSLGQLIEYVLTDAKTTLGFISWKIDPVLYEEIIPYAWFALGSHTAALRKISQSYPMHIYCDKEGNICAAPQKLRLDYYYDAWADNDTVISKEYSSLYTTLPNIVNVTVNIPQLVAEESLAQDNLVFDITTSPTRTLTFSKPYVSDLVISIDKDPGVTYAYAVYSWGIAFTFGGAGQVYSIKCTGTAVDISNTSVLTRRDNDSVYYNGAVTRDVSADFIQTSSLATLIINRIFDLSEQDKYDASVVYRGDISLTINDPIILVDGIAPDNRYNIRRHELSWNGALSGSADINT